MSASKKASKLVRVHIRLGAKEHSALKRESGKSGVSMSAFARDSVFCRNGCPTTRRLRK